MAALQLTTSSVRKPSVARDSEELPMQMVTTIGLDIAKSVFQVHEVERRYVLAFFEKPFL